MRRRIFLKRLSASGLAGTLTAWLSSCGALIHPERVGQPRGQLDPAVVILDGLGLLLFLVPGLIAFAVDFGTGAIYLPPQYVGQRRTKTLNREGLVELQVDPDNLSRQQVESVVAEATGHTVRLTPGAYQAVKLESLSEMRDAETRLASQEPAATEVVFRCQSPE
jgi:hypothetical protein